MTQMLNQRAAVPETSGCRDRLSQCPDVLFCYGTLQLPEVLEALLGRIPARTPASAPGWRAAALEGRVYPGLVADALGGAATGLLLTDLSTEEWRILDAFEDDRYELRQVTLSTGDRGWAYIWPGGDVLSHDWSVEEFRTRHLDAYAARCARIAAELTAGLRRSSTQ